MGKEGRHCGKERGGEVRGCTYTKKGQGTKTKINIKTCSTKKKKVAKKRERSNTKKNREQNVLEDNKGQYREQTRKNINLSE